LLIVADQPESSRMVAMSVSVASAGGGAAAAGTSVRASQSEQNMLRATSSSMSLLCVGAGFAFGGAALARGRGSTIMAAATRWFAADARSAEQTITAIAGTRMRVRRSSRSMRAAFASAAPARKCASSVARAASRAAARDRMAGAACTPVTRR
jgi:hypothetical protein